MRYFILCLALIASSASAHNFTRLDVVSMKRTAGGDYIEILLDNTVGGHKIVCGIYNVMGELVAADTQITDNLATRVLIHYTGKMEFRAECVFAK